VSKVGGVGLKSGTQCVMKDFAVNIKPLVHRASIMAFIAEGKRRAVRYGKDGGLPNGCHNQFKHGGGFTRAKEASRIKES